MFVLGLCESPACVFNVPPVDFMQTGDSLSTYIHMFVFLQKAFIYLSPPLSALDPGNRG